MRMGYLRKHLVEHLGDARLRFTCKTCGHKVTKTKMIGLRGDRKPMSEGAVAFLVRYWNGCGGATMTCLHCKKTKTRQ